MDIRVHVNAPIDLQLLHGQVHHVGIQWGVLTNLQGRLYLRKLTFLAKRLSRLKLIFVYL